MGSSRDGSRRQPDLLDIFARAPALLRGVDSPLMMRMVAAIYRPRERSTLAWVTHAYRPRVVVTEAWPSIAATTCGEMPSSKASVAASFTEEALLAAITKIELGNLRFDYLPEWAGSS